MGRLGRMHASPLGELYPVDRARSPASADAPPFDDLLADPASRRCTAAEEVLERAEVIDHRSAATEPYILEARSAPRLPADRQPFADGLRRGGDRQQRPHRRRRLGAEPASADGCSRWRRAGSATGASGSVELGDVLFGPRRAYPRPGVRQSARAWGSRTSTWPARSPAPGLLSVTAAVRGMRAIQRPRARAGGLFAGLARALPGYLREPLDAPTGPRATVPADLARRGDNLAAHVTEGVLGRSRQPLPRAARTTPGIGRATSPSLVGREGVEGALERLYDAGVYVSLDEFKGRKPIVAAASARRRPRATSTTRWAPPTSRRRAAARAAAARGSPSTSPTTPARAIYDYLLFETPGRARAAVRHLAADPALWRGRERRPALRQARPSGRALVLAEPGARRSAAAWQHGAADPLPARWRCRLARAAGAGAEHVPLGAGRADRRPCLAELKAEGTPALVNTNASSGTRICLAAQGARPRHRRHPVPARRRATDRGTARVVAHAGSRAVTIYGMGEIGRIGLPCGDADGARRRPPADRQARA